MKAFDALLHLADRLLGENGCPWDRQQTLASLQPYLVEEVHELVEAIDGRDREKIIEELGDVFYTLVFVAKLGEISRLFTLEEVFSAIRDKLIRRHPHVFGEEKAESPEDVVRLYEAVKRKEQGQKKRKTLLEGIPPGLSALVRAQKVIQKLKLAKGVEPALSEREVGELLWNVLIRAEQAGIEGEGALRRFCKEIEEKNTGEGLAAKD